MSKLTRTCRLFNQSLAVLSADTEMLLFPVMSAVSTVLISAGFAAILYFDGTFERCRAKALHSDDYLVLFLWYYLVSLVALFFNSALVACANIRLSGGDPTFSDGLSIAMGRIRHIAMWAFVTALAGVLLGCMRGRSRLSRWAGAVSSVGWSLITYLVVPVLILEDLGIGNSIQRSAELLRKTWGEQISGGFGFGLLSFVLMLPGAASGLLLFRFDAALALILVFCYVLILSAVFAAVRGIFTVVLYRYAVDGRAPNGFSAHILNPTFRPRIDASAC